MNFTKLTTPHWMLRWKALFSGAKPAAKTTSPPHIPCPALYEFEGYPLWLDIFF